MKIVVNNAFTAFGMGVGGNGTHFLQRPLGRKEERTKQDFIEYVENNPYDCGDLAIATIPDEATDWEISYCLGLEEVIYVVDGKIHHAYGVDGRNDWDDDDEDWD